MTDRESEAGIHPPPVHDDGASAALAAVAALLGAGGAKALAQEVEQGHARIFEDDLRIAPFTTNVIGMFIGLALFVLTIDGGSRLHRAPYAAWRP